MSVSEGDGMVHVCAKVSAVEEIQRDFTVTFATIDGTGESFGRSIMARARVYSSPFTDSEF